jgi:hypothetical protein
VSAAERVRVEEALRRIDDLVTGLSHAADPAAREAGRELVERILDLHGLGLARIMALIAGASEGRMLTDRLAQDEQVRALLLLYGLHPEDAETRVRRAISEINDRLAADGVWVELAAVTANTVRVRVGGVAAARRQHIEEAIVDAAPDLDEVGIEWLDATDAADILTAAG